MTVHGTFRTLCLSWPKSVLGGNADLIRSLADVAFNPFETSSQLAFLGSFVNIDRMTVVVITFANLWWRST